MKCKHNWKFVDYDDTDPGIIWAECTACGIEGKAVTTKEELREYQEAYSDGAPDLLYLPDLKEDFEETLDLDAKALGIRKDL